MVSSIVNLPLKWKLYKSVSGRTLNFSEINNGNWEEIFIEFQASQYTYITVQFPKLFTINGVYDCKMIRKGWYLSNADNGQIALNVFPTYANLVSFYVNGENVISSITAMTVWYR